ncbi:MAG: OmpA family protein [Kofleriaceae bacterium]
MVSPSALKALVVALLGAGAADVIWINASLIPQVLRGPTDGSSPPVEVAVASGDGSPSASPPPRAERVAAAEPPTPAAPAGSEEAPSTRVESAEPAPPADAPPTPTPSVEPAPPSDEPPTPSVEPAPPRASAEPAAARLVATVYFDTMQKRLGSTARRKLDRLLKGADARWRFRLDGYADFRGDESLNQQLSRERADETAAYLVAGGIGESRLEVQSRGEAGSRPDDAGELWRDRRVEIRIYEGDTQ